ncbi:MAG TPA: MarR family transcriptional regulator [Pseudolysinimonas sp.]|nr:MarR family transcriptional regulator [Pseudolysinimonas sp.]
MADEDSLGGNPRHDGGSEAWQLTDVITRLRRVLRSSIRTDYPWETLPMAQVEILQRLSEEPGLRVSELAQRHRLATNTVSTLIQQMVVAGLVTRDPDEEDRRAVVLHLTELGHTNLAGWRHANQQRLTTALERLTRIERQSISTALPALAELASHLEHEERQSHTNGS